MIRVVGGEGDGMEAAAHSGGGAPDEQIFSQILPRRIGAGFRPCHLGFWTGPTQLMPISVDDRHGRGRKLPYARRMERVTARPRPLTFAGRARSGEQRIIHRGIGLIVSCATRVAHHVGMFLKTSCKILKSVN